MKNFVLYLLIIFNMNNVVLANNITCEEFKKFSVEYFKCKGNLVKDKTISAGKNIIKDTKDYQKDEWIEEKEKLNKTKEKILNQ
tara:strand:+ start:93 stop:344 length:252 start_codon:yes stop_codon:yes gene_type:complete